MIFLSYSWKNKIAARKIVEALATEQLPCWFDEQQLHEGDELRVALRSAIAQSDVYLYLVSKAANESVWVEDELKSAIGQEIAGKLKVIPVRLADNEDPLPPLLSGRVYNSLDPTNSGVARLAHNLAAKDGADRKPQNCRLSATVRLEEFRIVHTLTQARQFLGGEQEFDVLLLDEQYEALDILYWNVAEVSFPKATGSSRVLTITTEVVANIHARSREIIKELREICRRFIATDITRDSRAYYDAGHEQELHVLLHGLQWNVKYLQFIRDNEKPSSDFWDKKYLPEPFDGHRCDFVSSGKTLGSVMVPKYGHPFPRDIKEIVPWGLTSPFADIFPNEVGTAIGNILASRFIVQSLPSTEMPSPDSLTYGLSG